MRLTICLMKRYLSIVGTTLNSVHAFLNANCPSISHDQPSSPYFFGYIGLPQKAFLMASIGLLAKVKNHQMSLPPLVPATSW